MKRYDTTLTQREAWEWTASLLRLILACYLTPNSTLLNYCVNRRSTRRRTRRGLDREPYGRVWRDATVRIPPLSYRLEGDPRTVRCPGRCYRPDFRGFSLIYGACGFHWDPLEDLSGGRRATWWRRAALGGGGGVGGMGGGPLLVGAEDQQS